MNHKCEYCRKPITDKTYSFTKWQMSFGLCNAHQKQEFIDELHNLPKVNGVQAKYPIDLKGLEKYQNKPYYGVENEPLDWKTQQEVRGDV